MKSGWVENFGDTGGQNLYVRFCGYEECRPGYSYGPAVRQNFLIHFILRGEGKFHKNSTTYDIHGGMAFMIFPGEITTYAADSKKPWDYFWIGFDGAEAGKIVGSLGITKENPVVSCESMDVTIHMNKMLGLIRESRVNQYALTGTLYMLFSLFAEKRLKAKPVRPSDLYVSKAVAYIQENYCYDILVGDIAAYIGVDRSHLYKVFQDKLSMSVSGYILQYRLSIASKMLLESDFGISQIGYSCGFHDANHFSKMFKAFYQQTPGRYRNNRLSSIS